jgi:hypothetical protein
MKLRILMLAGLLAPAAALAQAQPAAPSGTPPAAPLGGDHVLRFTNGGKGGITAIYVAKSGTTDVSDDLLGKQTAGVGKTVVLKVKDPSGDCVFDIQFLMNDGSTITRKAVNLCQTSQLTLTP